MTATSGEYDPLIREWDISNPELSEEAIVEIRNYEAAKLSVRQTDWKSLGFQNSADYLRKLFQDDGLYIEGEEVESSDPISPAGQRSPRRGIGNGLGTTPRPIAPNRFGRGPLAHDRFEKAYYEKHPELFMGLANMETGDGRPEWALSSEDLNKIVRDTASR
jgi:hypothetical protein